MFAESIKIDDVTLRTVVSHLEAINLTKTDLDVKGVAFEQFMDSFFKGDFGQYFTPREIIRFAVAMADPKSTETVLDPACGSGGFLLYALEHVRHAADDYYERNTAEHFDHWNDFVKRRLFGIEINDEITRVAKMNMIIHGDGHTNVVGADALGRLDRIRQQTGNDRFAKDYFDLVLTNPPFGSQIALNERPYLADYRLGAQTDAKGRSKARKNQKTEILYIKII